MSPCSAWPVLRGGLEALCLVSQLSVWSRGAHLRRLGQRRCKCNSNSFQGESSIPAPTSTASPRSRHRGTLCLPVIDLAPRGEDGMVASSVLCRGRGGRVICQLHQLGPPLCGPPHRQPSPRTPRMGLMKGKNPFQDFYYCDIHIIYIPYCIVIVVVLNDTDSGERSNVDSPTTHSRFVKLTGTAQPNLCLLRESVLKRLELSSVLTLNACGLQGSRKFNTRSV